MDIRDIHEKLGDVEAAEFTVEQGTEYETITAGPKNVVYGTALRGPMVIFNFNKYHAGLPPWGRVESFTLYGKKAAEFGVLGHRETRVTGDLKTVSMISRTISIKDRETRESNVRDGTDFRVDGDLR